MKKACVIGAGAWGAALAMVLCDNGYQVFIWARNEKTVEEINQRRQVPRLAGIQLPPGITAVSDPLEAARDASIVVSAVPSSAVSEVARTFAFLLPEDSIVVSATKGFDEATLRRPSEVWKDIAPSLEGRLVVISGPNFAQEIAQKLPAATVIAGKDPSARELAQTAFMTRYFRVYTHWDVIGVELGGALKNIIALACGMVEGMGLGYNAQAGIISRGIAEVTRLGVAMGADPLTFAGLSGLGDLVLTSTGHLSRNRQAGIAVGKGEPVQSFLNRTGYTVEGLSTVKTVQRLAAIYKVSMPITDVVYRILYENLPVHRGLYEIMNREKRAEPEDYFVR
ncbi:MAG TPA: NAD(P)-dependent glycerol-3-phosphate dehydrogenase [Firmicutes bacterium]|nr:NAD(P)-dependent glycerol-3-phosphate dehydrogenase [Candidatus Fermentithermobacillaceae bacterium]